MTKGGSMTMPQQFGNWLAALLIKLIWNYPITDLGPFRAIRFAVPDTNIDLLILVLEPGGHDALDTVPQRLREG